jgi:hypothetical protein
MRRCFHALSAILAISASFTALVSVPSPVAAQPKEVVSSTGIYLADRLHEWKAEVDSLGALIAKFRPGPYCKPPPPDPNVARDVSTIEAFKRHIDDLDRRRADLEKVGKSYVADVTRLGAKSVRDAFPRMGGHAFVPEDEKARREYWIYVNREIAKLKVALANLKARYDVAVASASVPCGGQPSQARVLEFPEDWRGSLRRPILEQIVPPKEMPKGFCSSDDKHKWLRANIFPLQSNAALNTSAATGYRGNVRTRLAELQAKAAAGYPLAAKNVPLARAELQWAEANLQEQINTEQEVSQLAQEAARIPIIDCPKDRPAIALGAIPTSLDSLGLKGPVEPPQKPPFCTQADKDKYLATVREREMNARHNVQILNEFVERIHRHTKTNPPTPELTSVYTTALDNLSKNNRAATDLNRLYEKARYEPLVKCEGDPKADALRGPATGREAPRPPTYLPVADPLDVGFFCVFNDKRAALEFVQAQEANARKNAQLASDFAESLAPSIQAGTADATVQQSYQEARELNTFIEKFELGDVPPCGKSDEQAGQKSESQTLKYGDDTSRGPVASVPRGQRDITVSAGADVAFGEQHLPTFVYLGFENALLEQTFAVENLDDDVDFTAFGGDLGLIVDDPLIGVVGSKAFFAFGFNTFDVDGSTFRSEIDPLGQDLLLAFPITPGISLGSGVPEGMPGGANVVTDFAYRYDADQFSLYAKYGERWDCWDGVFTGYAGLAYTNLDQRQFAGGDIPGFFSSFAYDTNVEVDTWRIVAGLRYERPLWDNSLGSLRVFGDAMGSVNFVDGEGWDSVDVSGFLNFSEAMSVSKSDTTFSYSLGAGIVQHIDEAAMDVYLAYRHYSDETTPVVVRHDAGPSRLTFGTSEFDVIVVGARVQF